MEQYVGLDVLLKETDLCVVDQTGTILAAKRAGVGMWLASLSRPGNGALNGADVEQDQQQPFVEWMASSIRFRNLSPIFMSSGAKQQRTPLFCKSARSWLA